MKRKDLLILAIIVAASLGLFLLSGHFPLMGGGLREDDPAYLRITVPGRDAELISLDQEREITLDQENGGHNVVEIFKGGFRMKESNCKNQECIQQGEVTPENLESRALYNQVICLPNKVVLELVNDDSTTLTLGGDASQEISVNTQMEEKNP